MFWFVMLVTMLIVIGASVLVGLTLKNRSQSARRLSKHEQVTMAKASGAFPQRKESN